jgi:hypothetical protein
MVPVLRYINLKRRDTFNVFGVWFECFLCTESDSQIARERATERELRFGKAEFKSTVMDKVLGFQGNLAAVSETFHLILFECLEMEVQSSVWNSLSALFS